MRHHQQVYAIDAHGHRTNYQYIGRYAGQVNGRFAKVRRLTDGQIVGHRTDKLFIDTATQGA